MKATRAGATTNAIPKMIRLSNIVTRSTAPATTSEAVIPNVMFSNKILTPFQDTSAICNEYHFHHHHVFFYQMEIYLEALKQVVHCKRSP